MDRLKSVLAVLKKQHFWVLCGVVVVMGLGLWWKATSSVGEACADRTQEIEGVLDQMNGIVAVEDHPNQKVIEFIDRRTVELKQEVLEAWKHLYRQQKEKNPLPAVLSPEFRQVFEDLGKDDEIPWPLRNEYMNFIGGHIPTLFETVDILQPAPFDPNAANPDASGAPPPYPGFRGGAGAMDYDGRAGGEFPYTAGGEGGQYGVKMIGVVDWFQADRDRLWHRFNWQIPPTTEELRLAQEDLWVYEALARIIKNTNGPVKNHFDAAIQQIQALQIGRDAAGAGLGSAGGVFMAMGTGGEDTEADGAYDGPVGMGIGSRYVDDDGRLLATGVEPPYAEFNLMPIRMLLVMNQTKLAKLLVECANSNMPVEVKSVRLGPEAGSMLNMGMGPGGGGLDYDSGDGGDSDYDGEYNGAYPSYSAGVYGSGGGSASAGPAQQKTLYIPVEIQGTICIYNPPDEDELGTGAAAAAPPEPLPATPPAAAPTAAPAPGVAAVGGQPPATGQ